MTGEITGNRRPAGGYRIGAPLALALILTGFAAGAAAAYQRATLSRFAVDVPAHWSVVERSDTPLQITFKVEEDVAGRPTAACLFRAVDTAGLFEGRSAIEVDKTRVYAISPDGMRMGLPEGERGLEWGETSISGEPAGFVVTQSAEIEVRRLSVMAMTARATYFAVCSTHAEAFVARRAEFERIIGSFTILE